MFRESALEELQAGAKGGGGARAWLRPRLSWLVRLSSRTKQLILLSVDTVIAAFSTLLAAAVAQLHATPGVSHVVLRFGSLYALGLLYLLHRFGAHKTVLRYARHDSYYAIVLPVSFAAAAAGLGALLLGHLRQVWGLLYIAAITSGFLLLSIRVMATLLLKVYVSPPRQQAQKVAIFGTGEPARQLARALAGNCAYQPVMFVEDGTCGMTGRILCGLPVRDAAALRNPAATHEVQQLFLAHPSLSVQRKANLSSELVGLGLKIKVIPSIEELASGRCRIDDLREIQIDDLLGRDPVVPYPELLDATIRGRCVLVTGAGGSIGSELCRQIARCGPRRLVMLESNEYALYTIEQELLRLRQEHGLELEFVAALGSIAEVKLVRRLLLSHRVDTVYHAAAYKHVPLVEANAMAALHNNVFATEVFARTVAASGAGTFVLVSSDKAVRPVSIMGASKRLQEMIVQSVFSDKKAIQFCAVRFGNVLGSSGSVVPRFHEQIRRGGPITVTDPEITRYFMTIPEAVQLVLQAGALARKGDIFILDMGQPVKIAEMARRMIRLSGKSVKDEHHPDGDIGIVYTGLRLGEKMYEELVVDGDLASTPHPRIFCANERCLPREMFEQQMLRLRQCVESNDEPGARQIVRRLTLAEQLPAEPAEGRREDKLRNFDFGPHSQQAAANHANNLAG